MILKSSDATTGCVMLKKMFLKILQNSRKSSVFEPLFNKIAGLQTVIKKGIQHNLKRSPTQDFSCEHCKTFKNIYFEKCLQMAASKSYICYLNSTRDLSLYQTMEWLLKKCTSF